MTIASGRIVLMIAVLGLLSVCGFAANQQGESEAVQIADQWLALVDEGQFASSWDKAAELFLKVGRGRQVVGMDMRLQNPLDGKTLRLHEGDNLIG